MADRPSTVSCIIPLYNRASMLVDCVESVLRQTYRPIEIVLVDDGSQDATPEIAASLSQQHPEVVKFIRQSNGGPGRARQTGLEVATGEFVQYLDSDDLLEPRKFELQVASLKENPEADVCYCVTLRHHPPSGQDVSWARTAEPIERIFPDFLMQRGWHTITPLWRKSLYQRCPGWSDLRAMEDWEHDLRAGMAGARVCRVDLPLAKVIDHEGERASGMETGFTPKLTLNYYLAHESIWLEMKRRGLTDRSYTEALSRKLFWLARLCGKMGLTDQADAAIRYAKEMIAPFKSSLGLDSFHMIARTCGWARTVRIADAMRLLVKN